MYKFKKHENISPETTANILSKLFFSWVLPYFKDSSEQELQMKDVYNTTEENLSALLGDQLERNWNTEVKTAREKKKPPSLRRAILKTFWKSYLHIGFWMTIQVIFLKTFQPVVLGEYIKYFEVPNEERFMETKWMLGAGVVLLPLLNNLFYHHCFIGCRKVGIRIKIACCSLIYRKLLKLSQTSLAQTSSGQVINLLSNDVQRLEDVTIYFHYVHLTPMLFTTAVYVLYSNIGIACIPGLVVMVLQSIPVLGYLSKLQGSLRLQIANLTDRRIRLINEIITGIQVIKMYAWTKPFEKIIELARKLEINCIIKTSYIRGYIVASVVFTERLCVFLSIISHSLLGHRVTGDVVFCIVQLYNILQNYMCFNFVIALSTIAETKVSILRLEEFLSLEEKVKFVDNIADANPTGVVKLNNVSASWLSNGSTLNNITLDIKPGMLICVLGSVGCGKSSLLQMLLEELVINEGQVEISGKISYASQEPWLFVSSVRNNILFGREYNENRYEEVVRICDMENDFRQFPYGDKTLIGERGVSLSGGQRARVNLARAVYAEADIYLLDDPLSAVDTRVSKHIFDECILNYLKNKTRILVTHNLQFSQQADLVVIMDKGEITQVVTKNDLTKNLLNSLNRDLNASEEKNDEICFTDILQNELPIDVCEKDSPDYTELLNKEVSASSYKRYFMAGSNLCVILFIVFLFLIAQISSNVCDLWVTYWVYMETFIHNSHTENFVKHYLTQEDIQLLPFNISAPDNKTSVNLTDHFYYDVINEDKNQNEDDLFYIYVYTGVILACVVLTIARSFLFIVSCMNASRVLHNKMLTRILRAPMRFFDSNASGRIINRFSKDMGIVDEALPIDIIKSIQTGIVMIGILIMILIIIPWIIVPIILIACLMYYVAMAYLAAMQKIKALEGNARSPVYSHIAASYFGITTIRSSNEEELVKKEFDFLEDQHTSTYYLFAVSSQAFGFYIDLIVTVFLAIVTFKFIVFEDENTFGGYVGLAIAQATVLTGMVQAGVRFTTGVISNMISVERILQYTDVESEEVDLDENNSLPKNWPQYGNITFKHISLRYDPMESLVLIDLNIVIRSGEKIGIVGRTGAGKSSLIAALFRLVPIEGSVIIDGVDTSTINLNDLRSNISIIPQEPILFSATVRYNLDPLEKHDDGVLWKVIENVELKQSIKDLNQTVSEGGSNFSVGQRQLICLARALIRNNKILVMDEATANVDPQTDSLIQATIRKYFEECTVLTIAHRLNTVMDSDKIMVMDYGRVVEYAHAHQLLTNPNGYFTKMVEETGTAAKEHLRQIAYEDFKRKHDVVRL